MKVTYYGHACISLQVNDKYILIDPFISANDLAKHIDINALKADYILITHAHQDHILDVETIAQNTGAVIISNYEITKHYVAKEFNGYPLNHGGSCLFDDITIKYVNAVHTSSFPDGSYGGEPGGFVVSHNGKSVYIAGDTALTYDMKLIPLFNKIDLAVLPIGDNFTMGVEEAIVASDFVECNKILGFHYDTFPSIKIDKDQAIAKFSKKGKKLMLLEIGNSIEA